MTAIRGSIDANLCVALIEVRKGFEFVQRLSREDPSLLELPGNHDDVLAEITRELTRYRRALEKLLPAQRRREFGIDSEGLEREA